jgi:hypothetical protein
MGVRGKSNLIAVMGILVVAVVLALVGAMVVLTLGSRKKDVPLKSAVQVREDEIQKLEQLLRQDIVDAGKEGKTEVEIGEMKAKYNAEINRLKSEIETIKAGGQVDSP